MIGIKSFQEQTTNEAPWIDATWWSCWESGDLLVVAGLGSTAWDITAAGDTPLSFPTVGRDGQRGDDRPRPRARAAKRRVLVITGDGEMLMGSARSPPSACSSRRT